MKTSHTITFQEDDLLVFEQNFDAEKPYNNYVSATSRKSDPNYAAGWWDSKAPYVMFRYETPEQIDAHIAILQEHRAAWTTPGPPAVLTAEGADIPAEAVEAIS